MPTDSDSPIRVLSARAIPPSEGSCTFATDSDPTVFRGGLDISARSRYLAQFEVESTVQPIETQVDDDVLAGPERNDFIAEQLILNYEITGSTTALEQETIAIYSVFRPQATNQAILDLIGPKAAATLAAAIPPDGAVELIVRFQLAGKLAHGTRLRSTEVTFPITVENTGFTGCPTDTAPNPTGPCGTGGGQDGVPVVCCPVDATTGEVTCPEA